MILDPEWQALLNDLADHSPGFVTAVVPVPPDDLQESDLDSFADRAIPLLELRIDAENQEITLHTDPDEDAAPPPPISLSIRDVVVALRAASFPPYPLYCVSGWKRFVVPPEDRDPGETADRVYGARLAQPVVGIAVSEVDHQVLFMVEEGQSKRP